MHLLSVGERSPYPALPEDGGTLLLEGQDGELSATCVAQLADIDDVEREAFRKARLNVSLTRLSWGGAVMPVFVFRVGGICFECPYALGVEPPHRRDALQKALRKAGKLTSGATWMLNLDAVDRVTNRIEVLRVVTLTPRFWQMAADAILASANIDGPRQKAFLRKAYSRFPTPQALAGGATIRETAGLASSIL